MTCPKWIRGFFTLVQNGLKKLGILIVSLRLQSHLQFGTFNHDHKFWIILIIKDIWTLESTIKTTHKIQKDFWVVQHMLHFLWSILNLTTIYNECFQIIKNTYF
jgi:hypothetical protein